MKRSDPFATMSEKQLSDLEKRLTAAAERDEKERNSGAETGDNPGEEPQEITWGEPLPLITTAAPETYPLNSLPAIIRDAVNDVSMATAAPMAMIASCAIAAASLACQGLYNVQRAHNLTGPTSTLFLSIGDSGERKSTVDSFFMRGIREYESNSRRDAKPEIDAYRADEKAWAAEIKGIEGKIQRESGKGSPVNGLVERLKELESKRPEPPKVPRLTYADATMEAISYGLAKWPSAGLFSSEGGAFFGSYGMGKDSSMRSVSLYNLLWDGSPITFDRRSCESIALVNTRLTISLLVQESTFRNYLDQHGNGDLLRGSGFLARFLICWPESTQGTRLFRETPEVLTGLETFKNRVVELLRQTKVNDDGLDLSMLDMSKAAFDEWRSFHDEVEKGLVADGEFSGVRDVAAKCADNAARLAAIFHLFNGSTGEISVEAMRGGCDTSIWHLSESRRFFGALALPPKIADAAKLETWLVGRCKENGKHPISTSVIAHDGPNALRKKEVFERALQFLCEYSRAQIKTQGNKTLVWINPELLEADK